MPELPSSSELLVAGGDERIRPLAGQRCNKYGISPGPATASVEFSSSTASHISADAFAAVESLRARLCNAPGEAAMHALYQQEFSRIRSGFFELCGLQQAEHAGTGWIVAESGTDAHFSAVRLAALRFRQPFRIVMPEFIETGRAVCDTLRKPNGVDGATVADIVEVRLRNADGSLRSIGEIDRDFHTAALVALAQDIPVLLIRADESKTGCRAPSADLLHMLVKAAPERVAVLIDACQLRISRGSLRGYLVNNYMVALTASKFFAAPSFCGALMVPPAWRAGLEEITRADACSQPSPNPGLLARWEAGLHTMQQYFAIPAALRQLLIARFGQAVHAAIQACPGFDLLARSAGVAANANTQDADAGDVNAATLFAFRVRRVAPSRHLTSLEMEQAYRTLQQSRHANGSSYLLGQPVACGSQDFQRTQCLRISLSATMVIELSRLPPEEAVTWLDQQVMTCLQTLKAIVDQQSS
ncbi:hypothetical protein PQR62_07180 [Herbaspirillum lusitanum]|uniref:Aminotransferase class I/classII domain-containing protein n=1 Tax=Herbaspirillum lusitanum TaxID=213312 RepID=A0ABW9A6H8_9BURK